MNAAVFTLTHADWMTSRFAQLLLDSSRRGLLLTLLFLLRRISPAHLDTTTAARVLQDPLTGLSLAASGFFFSSLPPYSNYFSVLRRSPEALCDAPVLLKALRQINPGEAQHTEKEPLNGRLAGQFIR